MRTFLTVVRVMCSVPSRIAEIAAARMRWERLPIMPPVRWCRCFAIFNRVFGSCRCRRRVPSMDARPPLGVEREGTCAVEDATAGELLATDAGEQPRLFDVDAGIGERRGQMLGEVLQAYASPPLRVTLNHHRHDVWQQGRKRLIREHPELIPMPPARPQVTESVAR
ncbi:hypothetical protein ACFT7S_30160 [Streptomyces sp. NPDC057136]|uniref:hypothetical protein n=1 Tax=Streptomyces sp. NPDC057136 TaxID=3346029 RepID=UPI003639BFEA